MGCVRNAHVLEAVSCTPGALSEPPQARHVRSAKFLNTHFARTLLHVFVNNRQPIPSPIPTVMVCRWLCRWFTFGLLASGFAPGGTGVVAYEVPIRDSDYDRQVCSGMWAGENTFINGKNIVSNSAQDPH